MEVEEIIPADVKLAAKRGFIRTTTQAYATAFSGGISTSVIIGMINGTQEVIPFVVTWVVAIISPVLAGVVSYLSIMSNGVPDAYQPTIELTMSSTEDDLYN